MPQPTSSPVLPAGSTPASDTYCTSGTSPTNGEFPVYCERGTLPFHRTSELDDHPCWINYECVGPRGGSVVVVLGGISAGRHVCASATHPEAGWWDALVGYGKAIDTARYRVLGIDWLGGPESGVDPATPFNTSDQARAIIRVLDHLEVACAAAIVGASYGGMVALALCAHHGDRFERAVCISGAHRTHPMATALRSLQRRVAEFGADANRGDDGLSIARGIAMTTYRTSEEFDERFGTRPLEHSDKFPVESYLHHHGKRFSERFGVRSFLQLSESLDRQDVDPSSIQTPLTLVAVDSDTLVPTWLVRETGSRVTGPCQLKEISSTFGHDAFLKEPKKIGRILHDALDPGHRCRVPVTATTAVRAAIGVDREHGAVMPPLHLSANFGFRGIGKPRKYDYTRSGNPTRDLLGTAIAELEGGVGGVVTSSGMAAINLVTHLVDHGRTVLAPLDCYGGTRRLLDALSRRGRFTVAYAWLHDAEQLERAFERHQPALVLVETPSNPLLRVTDLTSVRKLCDTFGTLLVADNTFLSPALQRPIAFGADLVVHSTTKFLNGHSDVVGGAVVARDEAVHQEIAWWANCLGVSGAPFDSYLTLRGLRTLHARTVAHAANTDAVVDRLTRDERVSAVYHPSLDSHEGSEVAKRQQTGPGSIVSFELLGGNPAVCAFVNGLQHFSLAESLGGVESLVAHPATMTHASMSAEDREAAGIGDNLLRLSIGIEDTTDLVSDVTSGLERAGRLS